jgi:hypothetical protein
MSSPTSSADSARALERIIGDVASANLASANEATLRVSVIDRILAEVLGWARTEFHPEEYAGMAETGATPQRRTYLDYYLQAPPRGGLIVEAKRASKTFQIERTRRDRHVLLHTLERNSGPELSQALKQAKDYCSRKNNPAFLVTNGSQWIGSLASWPYVENDQIQAIVFYNLEDVLHNLGLFRSCFSRLGIEVGSLRFEALRHRRVRPEFCKRLNDVFTPKPPSEPKNYLSRELSQLMAICFADLTDADHREMLMQCYVTGDTTDEYMTRLELFAGQNLPDNMVNAQHIGRDPGRAGELFSEPGVGDSVLLVGKKGSGKSTFMAHVAARLGREIAATGVVLLHVDLINRTEVHADTFDHDQFVADVCTEILTQAEHKYPDLDPYRHDLLREIFNREIHRLEKSLSPSTVDEEREKEIKFLVKSHRDDPRGHLKSYLGFLAKRNVRAVILLDNVDRGTLHFEKSTYQIAQLLSGSTSAVVVTCLRDTTVEAGRGNFLDVKRHTIFTISPPSFADVANKRFGYVKSQLSTDERLWRRLAPSLKGGSKDRLFDFAEILAQLVLSEESALSECIQALAGTNVRSALEILEAFSTSPSNDIEHWFKVVEKNAGRVQPDGWLRVLLRGKLSRYSEKGGKILNLFQVSPSKVESHFVAIRALQYLSWHEASYGNERALTVNGIKDQLFGLSYDEEDVLHWINKLGSWGLVLSPSKGEPPWSGEDAVTIGAAGIFYLERLVYAKDYITAMADDTNIYDEDVFKVLVDIHKDETLGSRRYEQKAITFLRYLVDAETHEIDVDGVESAWVRPLAKDIAVAQFGSSFLSHRKRSRPPPSPRGGRRR